MTKSWTARINPLFALALAGTVVSAIGTPSRAADNAREAAKKAGEAAGKAGEAVTADAPFWVPAARLATDKPQRIEVNNKTGVTLEYLITTHTDFRTLAPGKSVTLTNFTTPVFVNINPQESNYLVAYKVSVNTKTNTLVVNVTLTNNLDNRTLNLDETGAVYLY
jgi:hypothetical protein